MVRSNGKDTNPSQSDLDWVKHHRETTKSFIEVMCKETVTQKLKEETPELKREMEIRKMIPHLIESYEKKEDNWVCALCEKEFQTQETLENHIKNLHNDKVEGVVLDVEDVELYEV